MNKYINRYTILYTVQLVLNIICFVLVDKYYSFIDIPISLLDFFAFELSQIVVLIVLMVLLLIFFVVTLIFLIVALIQSKNSDVINPVRKSTIILPLVFVFLLQFSVIVPAISTRSVQNIANKPVASNSFEQVQESGFEVDRYCICEKNLLGKAAYFEQNTFLTESSKDEANFLCSYQKGNHDFVNNKFERYENNCYKLINEASTDEYTFYYESDDEHTSYSMIIEKDEIRFVATFDTYNNDYFDSYSKENFISDSLEIFNEWDSF